MSAPVFSSNPACKPPVIYCPNGTLVIRVYKSALGRDVNETIQIRGRFREMLADDPQTTLADVLASVIVDTTDCLDESYDRSAD